MSSGPLARRKRLRGFPVSSSGRRCYQPRLGSDEGRCDQPARYEARLTWTAGVMLLCVEHAVEARSFGDVVEIHTLGACR